MADISATQSSAREGDLTKDEWETPAWLWNTLDSEFAFNLDAAATKENTKCTKYYDKEKDGLSQCWKYHTAWLNPPYSTVAAWYKKAYEEAISGNATTVMLVAARTDTRYWWDYASKAEVRFLKGRLKFQGGKHSAPFPSAIVIFHKDMEYRTPATMYWGIKEEK